MLVSIHKRIILQMLFLILTFVAQSQIWSINQCIDTALIHNKNLLMNRNNIGISEQKILEAKSNLIPKLTVNTDYKYYVNLPYQLMPLTTFNPAAPEGHFKEAQFGVPHNINANLQLSMPIYNPQIYGIIQSTKIATELSELQFEKSEEQIYFEITNLYYNAQILQHQIAFIDSNIINAEKLYKNMQLLNEQLLVKGTDVNKVKLQLAQITSQKESVNSKYEQVLNVLKFTMGISIEQKIQLETNIHYQSSNEFAPISTLEIQIVKTQKRLLLSELSTFKKSRLFPSFNLIGIYGTTGFGYDKKPNAFLKFYPIGFAGVQISYPLFSGTVTNRKINQKKIELKNNELQISLLNELNKMQIENSKRQISNAIRTVETSKEQIELGKSIYIQTVIQQKQGNVSLTEVLLADNALREAQQSYLSAVIEYFKADLELKKLSGNISKTNNQ